MFSPSGKKTLASEYWMCWMEKGVAPSMLPADWPYLPHDDIHALRHVVRGCNGRYKDLHDETKSYPRLL